MGNIRGQSLLWVRYFLQRRDCRVDCPRREWIEGNNSPFFYTRQFSLAPYIVYSSLIQLFKTILIDQTRDLGKNALTGQLPASFSGFASTLEILYDFPSLIFPHFSPVNKQPEDYIKINLLVHFRQVGQASPIWGFCMFTFYIMLETLSIFGIS